jgi:ribosomal protein S18 acetylase RimI-like enzyme
LRTIRAIEPGHCEILREQIERDWGSTRMATRGRLIDVAALPGLLAENDGEWLGYATYELRGGAMEICVLQSLAPGGGVGTALLAECARAAQVAGARRLWLITTNDNTRALRFYQRRGFLLTALHPNAVSMARRTLKPEIPMLGNDDIPIRDELELELPKGDWQRFAEDHAWPPT